MVRKFVHLPGALMLKEPPFGPDHPLFPPETLSSICFLRIRLAAVRVKKSPAATRLVSESNRSSGKLATFLIWVRQP